jgi:hypothetical protein
MSVRGRFMRKPGITCARLMEESELRIADIAREGQSAQSSAAQRMLDDTRLYHHWESEHERLMRGVAAEPGGQGQATALRRACFGLIHRKAMFDYLRVNRVTGRDRHAVFSLVFGDHDYVSAVIRENGNYLRSSASFMCTHYVGLQMMADRAFGEPLWRYEQLYAEYFRLFCSTALSADEYQSAETLSTLMPYLKGQLSDLRRAILALTPEPDVTVLHNTFPTRPAANTSSTRLVSPFRAA